MKVIMVGSSGMIGKGALLECLDDSRVQNVVAINRSALGISHLKFSEILHTDFTDFTSIANQLSGYDACFFCLGVSAVGMKEVDYRKITYDYTLAAARTLHHLNPNMTFIYVSGKGTDSTEKSSMMWARVKGKTENDVLNLGFKQAFMFRPGAIIPHRGIKSRTPLYQFLLNILGWLLYVIRWVSPDSITDTTKIGRAMINVHVKGYPKQIIDPVDINTLAA